MRFWDSSAIVPLIARHKASALALRWYRADSELVIWTLTPVELMSAVEALRRAGRMDEAHAVEAAERIDELVAATTEVIDLRRTREQALRLLRLHALSGADALQLGAALTWAEDRPRGRVFHTLDTRLAKAALREGFSVEPKP